MPFIMLFRKTVRSVIRARLAWLMLLCALLAVLLVIILVASITWLTAHLVSLEKGWLDTLINWVVGVVSGVGGWFMLPVFIVLISGVFQEITIHKVEHIDYPDQMRKNEPQIWPDLMHDIRFTLKALLLNIFILPFYFIGIGFVLSVALNSYLLGREFFESAAGYHLGKPKARELGQLNKKMVYGSGLVLTVLTLIPVINLFAPIFAIVWMVHVFHSVRDNSQP